MGQTASSSLGSRGGRRRSLRASLRSLPKRSRSISSNGSLSAACNFVDVDRKFDQLNINSATEEELMTLPGINRFTAHTIVEYRQAIGRFKKVEDLALVSGIGADKLDLIRAEICVSRRKNGSCASSRAQSYDSLPSNEITRGGAKGSPQYRKININSSNVFELMTIHTLNQELAANIVHYRERRGLFKSVDDLIKVKGINQWHLGALRNHVYICELTSDQLQQNSYVELLGGTKNEERSGSNTQVMPLPNGNLLQVPNGKPPGHRKTMSAPVKYSPRINGLLPNKDIFELLSAYSQRPIVEEDFHNLRNGRPALRIASWNLHDFSSEKADNPGVLETVCRTILENSLSLIAVQEVVDNLALKKICDELNSPTLRRIIDWKDTECFWRYSSPSGSNSFPGLAFLYNANLDVEELSVQWLNIEGCESSMAVLARFQLEAVTVCLLNVYICDNSGSCFRNLHSALKGHVKETDFLVILGDFSAMDKEIDDVDAVEFHFQGVLPMTSSTNSVNGYQETRYLDNIYIGSRALAQYTGTWGIVRQGLTHLAIPRGWMWGGPASEHCPVWCELFTTFQENPAGASHAT